MRRLLTKLFFALAVSSVAATGSAQDLPIYEPRPIVLPHNARYVLRDGSISIVGYNDMAGIFANLNAIFIRTHPGFKFRLLLNGTATAAPALAHGVSAFAPMGAEFSALEIKMFKSIVGHEPQAFRVAHDSLDPGALSGPVGIYVNKANPLEKLTLNQLTRIFTTGSPGRDLTSWGQLGLKGEWANRPIHPAGIAEEAAAGLSQVMLKKMGNYPFAPGYDSFLRTVDVVKLVGENPSAIGLAWSFNRSLPKPLAINLLGAIVNSVMRNCRTASARCTSSRGKPNLRPMNGARLRHGRGAQVARWITSKPTKA